MGTVGRSLADEFSEEQFCSDWSVDLIIDAMQRHFRSFLEAEPEVQAVVALYQKTRTPKGTFVEFISNRIRDRANSLKELLPPKMKGFIIKRQVQLTQDQAKHFHVYLPTRGLEADRMVEALNRLDQTDALVEQILGNTAKFEQSSNRAHAHTVILCSNNHRVPRPAKESDQFTTQSTLPDRNLRASWTGTLSAWMMLVTPWLTGAVRLWYLSREVTKNARFYRQARILQAWVVAC